MVIARITEMEVLSSCREVLGLPVDQQQTVDDLLLAGLLRRSAGIHCPCSRVTLRASLLESLEHLSADKEFLSGRINAAIEALIVGGDLLELNDVVTEDTAARGTWIFAAPPSFVVRPSGGIFLFGIVPDQDTFLPSSLTAQIVYDGYTRKIRPQSDQDIAQELQEQGLQQLSDKAWLKGPEKEVAAKMLNRFEKLLATQPPAGTVSGLNILDPVRPVTYYRGRWTVPAKNNGTFVARRPQEFGTHIWCVAQLESGTPVRFLDLPLKRSRWRGCDAAWHLQMAIDHSRNSPQQYRRIIDGDGVRFDFFSPLPQWAQRRLMILGRSVPQERSLISYILPSSEAETEEQYLQQMLWLSPTEDSE